MTGQHGGGAPPAVTATDILCSVWSYDQMIGEESEDSKTTCTQPTEAQKVYEINEYSLSSATRRIR